MNHLELIHNRLVYANHLMNHGVYLGDATNEVGYAIEELEQLMKDLGLDVLPLVSPGQLVLNVA